VLTLSAHEEAAAAAALLEFIGPLDLRLIMVIMTSLWPHASIQVDIYRRTRFSTFTGVSKRVHNALFDLECASVLFFVFLFA